MAKKHCFFKKNVFFLSFLCRYAECSFDQSIEKMLIKASEFFPQNRVKRKNFRFSILFSKQLPIHVECSFNNPADQIFHSWPKICRSIFEKSLKNPRDKLLLRKILWTLRLHIWKPCWKSLRGGWLNSLKGRKKTKYLLLKPKTFLQNLPMDLQNAVLTFPQKKFDKNLYIFVQCPITMIENINFSRKKQFSPKISNGHAGCSFDYYVQKFFDTEPKKVVRGPKVVIRKIILFQKESSASNYSHGQLQCTFDIPAKKIMTKASFWPFKLRQSYKESIIYAKISYS